MSAIENRETAEAPPIGFAAYIREQTRTGHQSAEGAGFFSLLMSGELTRAGYALMLAQTYFIYRSLEAATERNRHQALAEPFAFDELTRLPSIVADLQVWVGPDWADRIEALPATVAYVDRIEQASSEPHRFVAHHYTRYLGDLSGGQIIGRNIERAYDTRDGMSFYRFDGIAKPRNFKDDYRSRLDALPLDELAKTEFIDEVMQAYRLNTQVFGDLEARVEEFRLPAGRPTEVA